jgi:hypothetical protein
MDGRETPHLRFFRSTVHFESAASPQLAHEHLPGLRVPLELPLQPRDPCHGERPAVRVPERRRVVARVFPVAFVVTTLVMALLSFR